MNPETLEVIWVCLGSNDCQGSVVDCYKAEDIGNIGGLPDKGWGR